MCNAIQLMAATALIIIATLWARHNKKCGRGVLNEAQRHCRKESGAANER